MACCTVGEDVAEMPESFTLGADSRGGKRQSVKFLMRDHAEHDEVGRQLHRDGNWHVVDHAHARPSCFLSRGCDLVLCKSLDDAVNALEIGPHPATEALPLRGGKLDGRARFGAKGWRDVRPTTSGQKRETQCENGRRSKQALR